MKSLEEITKYMAPKLGLLTPEEVKNIEQEIRKRVEQEIIERYHRTGRLGGIVNKLVDRIVDNMAREIVRKLNESNILDEMAGIASKALEESIEVKEEGKNEDRGSL